jgi:hypothetical protein
VAVVRRTAGTVLATSALAVITVDIRQTSSPSPSSLELLGLSTSDFSPLLFFFFREGKKEKEKALIV